MEGGESIGVLAWARVAESAVLAGSMGWLGWLVWLIGRLCGKSGRFARRFGSGFVGDFALDSALL